MNEANPLVIASEEEMDAADNMLASLSDIAYSTAPAKAQVVQSKRKSRFFFRLSKSFSEEVAERKQSFTPKQMTHVDAEVGKRLKEYRLEIPAELADNIDSVREFFLREIAPVTLATGAGATQAREVVKRLVGSDVDGTQFEKFERMMSHAVDIKMARYVARMLGLTKVEAVEILQLMKPRQPQIVPIGIPQNENTNRQARQKAPAKASDVQ